MRTVAILGAGPAGVVAARWLKSEGFQPVLFEQGNRLGGQWTGDARYSGVWPAMRANTSRVMTAFSDLPHERGTPVFPTNQAMLAYLERYAAAFDLTRNVRLGHRIEQIGRSPDGAGWSVRFTTGDGAAGEEHYAHVVVAPGRYYRPRTPDVPGLGSFSGAGGVAHTFAYKRPEQYRDMRVLVAGCSISALETASDLAMLGADVVVTNRRQRYVLSKIAAGVPTDHTVLTRFAMLAHESLPTEVVAANLKEYVVRVSGSPEQFGATKPADTIAEAGITRCQHFLPLVAEGHIETKPWIHSIDGQQVFFCDGSSAEFDAILFGTGFDLHVPFLSEEIRRTLDVDTHHIDLHKWTFHPDLPGLAFLGVFELLGPYFPTLETQARWIAYTFSGVRPAPSRDEMIAGVAACHARRGGPQIMPMHVVCIQLAREAGVEPDLEQWPQLARALLFGPLSAVSFRLSGPDALPEAPQRVAEEAAAFGAIATPELTQQERAQLRTISAARHDSGFQRYVAQLVSSPRVDAEG